MTQPWMYAEERSMRLDQVHAQGMTRGVFLWLDAPPFALERARRARAVERERVENPNLSMLIPNLNVVMIDSKVQPGVKETYGLLPFRALEEDCLPVAIQQRWEASLAAAKSARWRLWFQTLEQSQQKSLVQCCAMRTKDAFWAGLWLEYEEWSKPRRTRFVAAAARATTILEQERVRWQVEVQRRHWNVGFPRPMYPPGLLLQEDPEPLLSAPPTPPTIISLQLRLTPGYFRLPNNAFRFATQIFGGKSYDEAVAEKRANFNSWARESRILRIEGMPDHVVRGDRAVHKDSVPEATSRKNQPRTGEQSYRNRRTLPPSGGERSR